MPQAAGVVTFLFTDIEGSCALWEQRPQRMSEALARHDAVVREIVARHRGEVVKMVGDGAHAAFRDPLDAVHAAAALQSAVAALGDDDLRLAIRCGVHAGVSEARASDYFGSDVNRAARLMSVAHGGQVLVSHAVAALVRDRLDAPYALRDLGEVRLRGLANPEHVHQVLHPHLRRDFPAVATADPPTNLLSQLTSFVGRERELAEVAQLLEKSRLVTLYGTGGIGKTRLAQEVAARLLPGLLEGAWLVELAPVTEGALVAPAIAAVLGVKEQPGTPLVDALAQHLRHRRLLLVVDNCEHVLDACAHVVRRLLQATDSPRILATSREAMRIAGEALYPVPPLAVAAVAANGNAVAASPGEAVQLFVERARAVQPSFRLDVRTASIVADVCRRLDGIPLALELAAARLRAIPLAEVAARLGDRFRLLTGGDRTALPRQQTLRALIDWSHDLLAPAERTLFRRLAVFAGGWSREAMEAVTARDLEAEPDALALLDALVDKSLVVAERDGRYRFLESIHEYALQMLRASAEEASLREAHLEHFVAFAQRAEQHLGSAEQPAWLTQLDAERENLVAALAWSRSSPRGAALAMELTHALKLYWFNRGMLELGQALTVEALRRSSPDDRTALRSRALFDAGQMCSYMGRHDEARGYLQESLDIARELGDVRRIAAVLQPLCLASIGTRDFGTAQRYADEALVLAHATGDPREVTAAVTLVATLHRLQGRLPQARALYEDAVARSEAIGDHESVALGYVNLAIVATCEHDRARAVACLTRAHALALDTASRAVGQSVIDVAAGIAAEAEEPGIAARLHGTAQALATRSGIERDAADAAFLMPMIARARMALGERAFEAAVAAGAELDYERGMEEAARAIHDWRTAAAH